MKPTNKKKKELEYVYAITDSWNYMGDEVIDTFPRRFWDRVCQEKIKAPFTKRNVFAGNGYYSDN